MVDIAHSLDILSGLPYFYYPFIFIIGLIVGSFLNVVILRTPKMLENAFRQECCELLELAPAKIDNISLARPRSTCPSCNQPIKPWHNIPVISYLLLKGRCADCNAAISIRYPLVELATALLSVVTVFLLGFSAQGLLALVFLWCLISLTMIDIDTFLLPDTITLPLLWLGLLVNLSGVFTDINSAVWGAIAGYVSLWSVYWLFKLLTQKEGMGFGDFKLLAALGAWMGWQYLPLIILLSSFVGAAIGIAGIVIHGRDKNIPIPFGPYLAMAGWIALVWGDTLINAYLNGMAL
ncbi:MAG: A24 family peptidase [Pseudomonadota bacterium]